VKRILVSLLLLTTPICARAETPEEWIALGARIHGAFGAFIPLGIKIGLDAVNRLTAKPRELTVLYYDNDASPCACFADGIAIATYCQCPLLAQSGHRSDALQCPLLGVKRTSTGDGPMVRF
jgi:hypothetical protein